MLPRLTRPGGALLAPLLVFLYALALLIPSTSALQADMAGKVDWHNQLLGIPRLYPTAVAPRATRRMLTDRGNMMVLSVSEKNVFAGVDATTGEIYWRHHLAESDPVVGFYADKKDILLLSGPGASTIRMFDHISGTLRWEHHLERTSRPGDPAWVGTHATYAGDYVVVLSGGRRVTKLNRKTGELAWSWEFPADGGLSNTFTQVAVDFEKGKVFVIGYTTQFTAAAVHMVLDFDRIAPFTDLGIVPSHHKYDNTMIVRRADGTGHAAIWIEIGRIRTTRLDLEGKETETIDALPVSVADGRKYKRIIDVGTSADGYVVVELDDGSAGVVAINDEAKLVAFFEQSDVTKNGAPVYAGVVGIDREHKATFSRVAFSAKDDAWVQSTLAILPNNEVKTSVDATSLGDQHVVTHITITNSIRIPNFVYTTATGAVGFYCYSCDEPGSKWTRHESLTDLADVHFVDLGKTEIEEALEVMEEESFFGRLGRHIVELKDLPGFIISALKPQPEITAVDAKDLSIAEELASLQKIIVAVTRHGEAFGISPKSGRIMWSKALGFFSQDGPELEVKHAFVTRNNTEAGNPQLAVVAARTRGKTTTTLGYHVDALTGAVAGDVYENFPAIPLGKELFAGAPKTAFLTPFINCCTKNRVLAVVDDEDKLQIFPRCKKVANALEAMGSRLFYSVLETELEGTSLVGYAVAKQEDGMKFSTTKLWTRPFYAQVVHDNSPLTPSPTASYGRALGDKSVLYKYLNPHLQIVTTVSPLKAVAHVIVIDSTTGGTVYEDEISHVVGNKVVAAMVENWLVYAWLESAPDAIEGWRLASVELYDNSGTSTGASTLTTSPDIGSIARSYILATGITSKLGFTTSKFGVTTKDLVFANELGQVTFIPHRLLDPRRPLGKPTKAEQEEMLVPYNPLLPFMTNNIVSHKYPTIGVTHLTSAPTLLESTALLLASGLDMFCTSAIQPSGTFDILGSGFNKFQLVLTLAALAVGVAVAKPAVARKNLKEKWF